MSRSFMIFLRKKEVSLNAIKLLSLNQARLI